MNEAERLASLTDAELINESAAQGSLLDQLATAVVAKLNGSVISSSLPAYVGDLIRDACQEHQLQQISQLYLRGPYAIAVYWVLCPDGTLMQEMRDHAGQTFWRGMFRPVADG